MLRHLGIAALAVCSASAGAQDLASKIVNKPGELTIYGGTAKAMEDPKVQGGRFFRIESKGMPNPWDIGVANSITTPLKAGDKLILAFYAKAHGADALTLPTNGVQLAAAPYTPVFSGPVTLGPEWKLHQVQGKADKDYPAGVLGVVMHLSAAKQTVDLGPVVVLNMGQ